MYQTWEHGAKMLIFKGVFFFFYIYNINDLHKNNDLGDFLENLVVPRGKGS